MFIASAPEGDFVRLQRDFFQKYGLQKELWQYVWEAMHATFTITSTSVIVRKLPTGQDGEVIELSIFSWVKTKYLGPPKVKGSEPENEKQRKDQAKKRAVISCMKNSTIYEKLC